jgi:hypothetical protein
VWQLAQLPAVTKYWPRAISSASLLEWLAMGPVSEGAFEKNMTPKPNPKLNTTIMAAMLRYETNNSGTQ